MNGKQRYFAMLKGQAVDFLPRVPILMQFAAEYIGENYATFAKNHAVLVKANLTCAKDFGMDQLSAISDPYRETHGFGAHITFHKDGPPRCPHPPLEHDRDLIRLTVPDPRRDERMRDRLDALAELKRQAGATHSVMGWIEGPAAEAADLRGPSNFLLDLADDPAYAEELMSLCTKSGIEFAAAQILSGADTIGIGDAIASQLSPAMYKQMVLPREKQMVDEIHEMGGLVRLHICGNITRLLPAITELGVDILDLDYMVDMTTARKAVGRKVALAGNLDPVAAVMKGTPASIRTHVRRLYELVGNPFMVAAGCEVPARTPSINLRALCEPVTFSDKVR